MSSAETNNAETMVAEGTAAAAVWTQSFLHRLSTNLQNNGAKFQSLVSPASASPKVSAAGQPERPATERAEEGLDQAGEKIGLFAAALSHQARRSVALAREEAEDILADAQALRHKR